MRKLRTWLVSILGKSGLLHQCAKYLEAQNIAHCHHISEAPSGSFAPQAKVHNWSKDSAKIRVGEHSRICGDLLVFPSGGQISIGRGCFLGENSRIWSMEQVSIGNHVLMSIHVAIMDTDSHEMDFGERAHTALIQNTEGLPKNKGNIRSAPITIGDHVWIGLGCIILKGVTIGEKSIVAAGSVVTKSVPPLSLVAGNPARVVRRLDEVANETT